ncbi:hypothetical protein LCGC14_2736000, partial [marine sediment metagenome]
MSALRQTVSGVSLTTGSGLDEIFDSAYEMDKQPGEVRATSELFFRQDTTDWLVHQYAESMGPGQFRAHAEDEEVDDATVRVANRVAAEVFEFDRDIGISQRYQESAASYGTVARWVEELGIRAMTSRDEQAFIRSYGNAFSTDASTPDGAALISASHTALSGDTIDNLETGDLTPDNLKTLFVSLTLQKDQRGDLGAHNAKGLL